MRAFAFQLCEKFHEPNVDAMLASVPARLLAEWQAYFALSAKVDELVRDGADPRTAHELVWQEDSD